MTFLRWLIFTIALLYTVSAIFSITIGQDVPYEFRDLRWRRLYFSNMTWMLPVAILATMTVTIRERFGTGRNTFMLVVTMAAAVFALFTMLISISPDFANWADTGSSWELRDNRQVRVAEQVTDLGAMAGGSTRQVKLTPFLGIFNKVEGIDISKLDKRGWVKIIRPGIIKFPE
ncbi:hypothetical protein [uncultured Chitinophaga sp.]|uniref:hypothetical protein n=1 Tax=uncultured Chitinophaga sp. TaxID=339340 RepID=UPI0025EBB22D|nr:hypothetical protein [uncultured Chitinophaga sp.]